MLQQQQRQQSGEKRRTQGEGTAQQRTVVVLPVATRTFAPRDNNIAAGEPRQNFVGFLHQDRSRLVLRGSSLTLSLSLSLPSPPSPCATRPPSFTWLYRQGPTCFRERIYISRNRPNFYTSRRRGPENKTTSFLPITRGT